MKIIDLLNKIANEEIPNRILFNHYIWFWTGDDYKTEIGGKEQFLITGMNYTWFTEFINDEVEILEETVEDRYREMEKVRNYKPNPSYLSPKEEKKIPEKLDNTELYLTESQQHIIVNKLNEIIDYLNSKGE